MCRQNETHTFVRRAAAAGCPLDVDQRLAGLRIVQEGDACIMDIGYGLAAVLLYMALARDVRGQIVVKEFGDLLLPWGALSVNWLDPLPRSASPVYTLLNDFSLERDLVLNDKLGDSGITLRRGHHVEGYVLGHTTTPIPQTYNHGALVDAEFSVVDIAGQEYRGDVRFFIDRATPKVLRPAVRDGPGLFAPDAQPPEWNEEPLASSWGELGGHSAKTT
jgi:hypothetical protein